jgi:hypothetical protein
MAVIRTLTCGEAELRAGASMTFAGAASGPPDHGE